MEKETALTAQAKEYQELLGRISAVYSDGQRRAVQAVNTHLLETYWHIGQHIVEFEQGGNAKAEYGQGLLQKLAQDLTLRHGKGFSRSNVVYMRLLYLRYPKSQKPSHQLSWSHFVELLKIGNDLERSFYEKQSILEKWSVPELKRQKEAALFERLALSQDPTGVLQLAAQGRPVLEPKDILREPYIFEFLKIPEPYHISEQELEGRLIEHFQQFLLELGKGFTFVGRQYRITLNNEHFYVDLVFVRHEVALCKRVVANTTSRSVLLSSPISQCVMSNHRVLSERSCTRVRSY